MSRTSWSLSSRGIDEVSPSQDNGNIAIFHPIRCIDLRPPLDPNALFLEAFSPIGNDIGLTVANEVDKILGAKKCPQLLGLGSGEELVSRGEFFLQMRLDIGKVGNVPIGHVCSTEFIDV